MASTVFGATRAEVATGQRFEARANFIQLKNIALAFGATSCAMALDYPEADFVRFQIGLRGRAVTIDARGRTEIDENHACITSSGHQTQINCDAGHERLTLRVNKVALEQKLISLSGRKPSGRLEFGSSANLNDPRVHGLWQLIQFFAELLDPSCLELPPSVLQDLENAIVIAFLYANRHTSSHLLEHPVKDIAPWQVRRVEDYIEAHWSEGANIETLAQVTGASARSIFQSFRRFRGYSPKVFAKMVRLKHARDMLSDPDSHTSVTGAAFACGFTNLGQFAKEFNKAFAELPSEMLARSKGSKLLVKHQSEPRSSNE